VLHSSAVIASRTGPLSVSLDSKSMDSIALRMWTLPPEVIANAHAGLPAIRKVDDIFSKASSNPQQRRRTP